MEAGQGREGLTKEQKVGAVLLSIFAVFAIGLGVLKILNTMYAPFALNKKIPALLRHDISGSETLVYRDTDKDGLNDFDELYVYSTSAYLADTYSDGIPDKTEVEKGTDPICPEGKDCAQFGISEDTVSNRDPVASATSTLGPAPLPPQDLSKILNNPVEIRKMLLDNGVEKKIIDGTSDADLLKMVKEILNSTSTTSGQ